MTDSIGENFERLGNYLFPPVIAESLMEVVAFEKVDNNPLRLRVVAITSEDPVWSTSFEVDRGEVEIGDTVRFTITKEN